MPPRSIRFQDDGGGGGGGPTFSVFADIGGDNTSLKRALDDGLEHAKTVFGELSRLGGELGFGAAVGGLGAAAVAGGAARNQVTEQALRRQLGIQGFDPESIDRVIAETIDFALEGFSSIAQAQTALFKFSRAHVTQGLAGQGPDEVGESMRELLHSVFGVSVQRQTTFEEAVGTIVSGFTTKGALPILPGASVGSSPSIFREELFGAFGEGAGRNLREKQETVFGALDVEGNRLGARLQTSPVTEKVLDTALDVTKAGARAANTSLDFLEAVSARMDADRIGAIDATFDVIAAKIRPALAEIDRDLPASGPFGIFGGIPPLIGRGLNEAVLSAGGNVLTGLGFDMGGPSEQGPFRPRLGPEEDPFLAFEPDVEGLNPFGIPGGAQSARIIATLIAEGLTAVFSRDPGSPIAPRDRRSPNATKLGTESP